MTTIKQRDRNALSMSSEQLISSEKGSDQMSDRAPLHISSSSLALPCVRTRHREQYLHQQHPSRSIQMKQLGSLFLMSISLLFSPTNAIVVNQNNGNVRANSIGTNVKITQSETFANCLNGCNIKPSSNINALALLNTARQLREQRTASVQRQKIRDRKAWKESSSIHSASTIQSKTLGKHIKVRKASLSNAVSQSLNSWQQTLFDDSDNDVDARLGQQDAFISVKVKEQLPSLKSLRTSLGSEIPDMELYLQMEAAKARASSGQGNTATLAFIDLHHGMTLTKTSVADGNIVVEEVGSVKGQPRSRDSSSVRISSSGISNIEKIAMTSLPSQLPELATSVLSNEVIQGGRGRSRRRSTLGISKDSSVIVTQQKQSARGQTNSSELSSPKKKGHARSEQSSNKQTTTLRSDNTVRKGFEAGGDGSGPIVHRISGSKQKVKTDNIVAIKKIHTKDISTIMSTRKTLSATAKKNGEQADNARSSSPTARVSHDEEIQLARIIQRGVEVHNLKSKFEEKHGRDISRQEWTEIAKLKSPKELRRIVSTYRKAKNKLVMANMGLVHAVVRSKLGMVGASRSASKTTTGGISYEELIQEGSLGLLRAAELFDPSRGLRFSTYATIWIKGVLGNSSVGETITLPAREKTKWNKIQKAHTDLAIANGGDDSTYQPTNDEIAGKLDMCTKEVDQLISKMTRAKNVLSLDYQYDTQSRGGTQNDRFQALANDKNLMDDVEMVEKLHVRADVIAALARNLDPREARLMRLRYGLNDGQTRSIRDCAEAMGISRARAHQLAVGCLKKLREADDAESLQEYLLSVA